jgi:hypothetical protein
VTRRRSTPSSDEMGDRNIEMATREPKVGAQAKEDARAIHILGGLYPTEATELARAARYVRRIAPNHAPEILAALDLHNLEGTTR